MNDALDILRAAIEVFEARAPNDDPAAVQITVAKIVGAISEHGAPPPTSKKPQRGLGLDKNDALVVASLSDFGNNMTAALKSFYPLADPEEIKTHAKRIRGHLREIAEATGEI